MESSGECAGRDSGGVRSAFGGFCLKLLLNDFFNFAGTRAANCGNFQVFLHVCERRHAAIYGRGDFVIGNGFAKANKHELKGVGRCNT